jgi:transcriptional regulator with XRE-family HTH domain
VEDVGLARVGRRRTPGLRREEVALLAGVSTDYYIRLEQGRERHPSEQVLDALARALDLDITATEYLYELAHPRPRRRLTRHRERVSPGLLRLLNAWVHTPAFITGRWMDMLATNAMADALYAGLDYSDNLLRLAFLNPEAQAFWPDWEKSASFKVAHLRAAAGADPDDPFLPELVEELSQHDEFRRLWARHDINPQTVVQKRFRHREVGDLTLAYESFTINSAPGQQLIIFQAEPGSPSEQALALLGALAARPSADATPDRSPGAGAAPRVHWRTP